MEPTTLARRLLRLAVLPISEEDPPMPKFSDPVLPGVYERKAERRTPSREEREALIRDRQLRRELLSFHHHHAPYGETEDALQDTYEAVLRSRHLPTELEKQRQYIFGIARFAARRPYRIAKRQPPREDGANPDAIVAQAAPNDPEGGLMIQKIRASLPEKFLVTFTWLARHHGYGETIRSIADKERVDYHVVCKRITTLRRWIIAANIAVVVVGVLLARHFLWGEPPVAHQEPQTVSSAEPAGSAEMVARMKKAQALREQAFSDCAHFLHDTCLRGLDEAQKLDPAGDEDPMVQDWRKRATDALNNTDIHDKPSLSPPGVRGSGSKGAR
jgi:hypothetical protein